MSHRILLADDHQIVREGFRVILQRAGFSVVGEAADGWQAVRMAKTLHPDLVVMERSMPSLNGLDAAREILSESPRVRVVLLTVHVEEQCVVTAFRAGIRGYVLKTQGSAELLDAVREVLAGGTYVGPKASQVLIQAYLGVGDLDSDPLTLREREVLQLVAEGKSTKEIGATLDLTAKTAEYYRSRVKCKLAIHDTAGLVRYAIRHGLTRSPVSPLLALAIALW